MQDIGWVLWLRHSTVGSFCAHYLVDCDNTEKGWINTNPRNYRELRECTQNAFTMNLEGWIKFWWEVMAEQCSDWWEQYEQDQEGQKYEEQQVGGCDCMLKNKDSGQE